MQRCSAAQLRVDDFGGSGAAGTALTGIGIGNAATAPCRLRGTPTVTFSGPAGHPISTTDTYGPHYSPRPALVVLRHAAPAHSSQRVLFTYLGEGVRP